MPQVVAAVPAPALVGVRNPAYAVEMDPAIAGRKITNFRNFRGILEIRWDRSEGWVAIVGVRGSILDVFTRFYSVLTCCLLFLHELMCFTLFYMLLQAPGSGAEIEPKSTQLAGRKALSRNCKKPLTPTQSKCLPQVVASSALSALAQDPVGAEAAVNS